MQVLVWMNLSSKNGRKRNPTPSIFLTRKERRMELYSTEDASVRNAWKLVKRHLKCGVCLGRFRDPVVSVCGHSFCKSCVVDRELVSCPECRAPWNGAAVRPNYELGRLAEAVKPLVCGFCAGTFVGPPEEHYRNCDWAAPCGLCDAWYHAYDTSSHLDSCPGAVVVCDACDFPFARSCMDAHLRWTCSKSVFCCGRRFLLDSEAWRDHEPGPGHVETNGSQVSFVPCRRDPTRQQNETRRKVCCRWCRAKLAAHLVDLHRSECNRWPTRCDGCDEVVPRKFVPVHRWIVDEKNEIELFDPAPTFLLNWLNQHLDGGLRKYPHKLIRVEGQEWAVLPPCRIAARPIWDDRSIWTPTLGVCPLSLQFGPFFDSPAGGASSLLPSFVVRDSSFEVDSNRYLKLSKRNSDKLCDLVSWWNDESVEYFTRACRSSSFFRLVQ